MTGLALPGSWLVEDYGLPFYFPLQVVAVATWNIPMSAGKGKRRTFIVIEQRRLPSRRVMAAGAVGGVFARRELAGVRILVTRKALFGSGVEVHVLQTGLLCWRTMTIAAGYAAVSADEREFCF